jgi:hypothetical protein
MRTFTLILIAIIGLAWTLHGVADSPKTGAKMEPPIVRN